MSSVTFPLLKTYETERIAIQCDDIKMHFYKDVVQEHLPFNIVADDKMISNFMAKKLSTDKNLKSHFLEHRVRYFNENDRKQTKVSFENGSLYQIGLDNLSSITERLEEGIYLFIIKNGELYMAPKIKTKDGKIQHSSFFCGDDVDFAGTMILDKNGKIAAITNASGHYQPHKKFLKKGLNEFLTQKLSKEDFDNILISTSKIFSDFHIAKIFSKFQYFLCLFYSRIGIWKDSNNSH